MANCLAYQQLSVREKQEMIGKISHLVQNDPWTFNEVELLIKLAETCGKFKGVKFLSGIVHPYQKNI